MLLFLGALAASTPGCKRSDKREVSSTSQSSHTTASASSTKDLALPDVLKFCSKKKINFSEVEALASHIKASTPQERTYALAIVSTIFSYKQYGDRAFVDTILAKIKDGGLTVEDVRGQKLEGFEFAESFLAYDYEKNCININTKLDINSIATRTSIIHELDHFYRDVQAKPLSLIELESSAFIRAGELLIAESGLTSSKYNVKDLEAVIAKEFADDKKGQPADYGLRVAYAQWGKDQQADKLLEELKDSLVYYYYLWKRMSDAIPAPYDKAQRAVVLAYQGNGIEALLLKADEKRSRSFRDLQNYLITSIAKERLDANTIETKVQRALTDWIYHICVVKFTKQLLDALNSGGRAINLQVTISEDDPPMHAMMKAFVKLHPSVHIYREYDGV
ncbi:MAG: hypothetical protein ABH871_01320 [Pseudomonadota bacterium]